MVAGAADHSCRPSERQSYAIRSRSTGIPASTLWRRANGKPSRQDKAANQQYLSPQEERALVNHVLRMAQNGYPLPVSFLRSLAVIIARQRSSIFQHATTNSPITDSKIRPPGKNWPQAFYKRHPELRSRRLKPIDWKRDDRHIEEKVRQWFGVIRRELADPAILLENVYNMDETGVLLSVLNSLKVLVSKHDLREHRGAAVKRTLVTAVECISADGRCLSPLIIWPATTHRSSWTTHPTPGWHFACSKSGYADTEISLYWVQHVFDPQTRDRAGGKPRLLISDGFGPHESLEVLKFCYANQIVLCRLPSHTSHKLQPCDVGVFGPLKAAYRTQVEQHYRGGANAIGKPHFTYLYDRARQTALTRRNIRSGWAKTGLVPFDPNRVLRGVQKSRPEIHIATEIAATPGGAVSDGEAVITTPVTADGFATLCKEVATDVRTLDPGTQDRLQKLNHAAERAMAERALLLDENRLLFEQNNEKTTRQSTGSKLVGHAKVMSYEDILEAQRKREAKTVSRAGANRQRSQPVDKTSARQEEKENAEREIQQWELGRYCAVLDL
ncbi:hypothetical protein ZTR_09528 [Talaromyces verruculosus]|nr:hypothetical protein ZTR_09528 [Talaromyces verruculosus]